MLDRFQFNPFGGGILSTSAGATSFGSKEPLVQFSGDSRSNSRFVVWVIITLILVVIPVN